MIGFVVTILALTAVVEGQKMVCNLRDGSGCSGPPPFKFTYKGWSHFNATCRHMYDVEFKIPYPKTGYRCTFDLDSPVEHQFIYSITEQPGLSTYSSGNSPFIHGMGDHTSGQTKSQYVSGDLYNEYFMAFAHKTAEQPNLTTGGVIFTVRNNMLEVSTSHGATLKLANPFLFTPTEKTQYIGLNRMAGYEDHPAGGLCKATCELLD